MDCWVETPKSICIVMEKADGDLKYTLNRVAEVLSNNIHQNDFLQEIMKGILSGVDALHKHGVCHLDLKPQNILICSKMFSEGGHRFTAQDVRIADFGLVKYNNVYLPNGYNDDLSFAAHKKVLCYSPCGTRGYQSPETMYASTIRPFEGRMADMWSIGCILQWMIYGTIKNMDILKSCLFQDGTFEELLLLELQKHSCRWNDIKSKEIHVANDLQIKLMNLKPECRPTAPQALKHDWFDCYDHSRNAIF